MRKPVSIFGLALLGWLAVAPASRAAIDMFLKADTLTGESLDKSHRGEIDILDWSWGISRAAAPLAGGGERPPAVYSDVTFTKWVDASTAGLMLACSNGKPLAEATLTIRKAGLSAIEFYVATFSNVLITSVSEEGSGGEDRLTERISIQFQKVKITYTAITPKDTAGTKSQFYWDVAANAGGSGLPSADTDGDGMPDDFERAFGLQVNFNDANEDLDGDGLTNLEEFKAGTNPTLKDSVLKLTMTYVKGAPAATLDWGSVAGKQYKVLFTRDLKTPFAPLGDYSASTNGPTTSIQVTPNLANGFFRIQTQ